MEKIWQQKYIDEVFTEINEKCDKCHVESLANDIYKHLNKLKISLQTMEGILGEPLTAAATRKIYRDTMCISCSTPAHIIPPPPPEELLPKLPPIRPPAVRPPAIGQEAPKQMEDVERPVCYPGRPIKHPLDKRAALCTRYCGGLPKGRLKKKPSTGITVVPVNKKATTVTTGTDGKVCISNNNN
ncbi:uncharacterized protein LOC126367188 [Pectinophora gossypiella]|uniref:uncharacterized protein LOC126367188 n=1 Tax=Pectinophora gossypiella TaxID=13191 RepID=UPI00214EF272|nr:uncharacterized protein LOC126367188 [Pectinophora gossypiella]